MLGDFRRKTPDKWQWVLWWRVDQDELQDQVEKYDKLGWFDAARKLSVLCLLLSACVTAIFGIFNRAVAGEYLFEAILFGVLAAFIYRGHRWAMIAAMVLWTIEKAFALITGLAAGPSGAGGMVVQPLWWAIYMHAFYLALRVERARRQQRTAATQPPTNLKP